MGLGLYGLLGDGFVAGTCAAAIASKAVAAVVRGSSGKRYSAHAIADGILHWVHTYKLCPRGISVQAASVRDWALRNGSALRKLV